MQGPKNVAAAVVITSDNFVNNRHIIIVQQKYRIYMFYMGRRFPGVFYIR